MNDAADRIAWFHSSHPAAEIAGRAASDRPAWMEYVSWHESAAGPGGKTPAQCRDAITRRLAASGPLRAREAQVRLDVLGFTAPVTQRVLGDARRRGTAAALAGGVRTEVRYRGRRYHVSQVLHDWRDMTRTAFGGPPEPPTALFPVPDICGTPAFEETF